ncbi:MAG: PLD nuclease N-terminal domain-containing protein [Actinomycetota bacterium]|nr:PLD nuclease N-terminal domain-containing protein [Actinomycetota bacterium]
MLLFDGFLGLVVTGAWIFCFIDVLLTPEAQCRNLPKLAWVFIVLLLPLFGTISWLVAGRPWGRASAPASTRSPSMWAEARGPAQRAPARRVQKAPDDDEEFLAGLRKRADEQRRRARDAQNHDQDERPDTV